MADLLGSILGSMQKPPSLGEEEKKKAKELKARLEKQQDDEKQKLESFRKKMQKKIQAFIQNGDQKKVKFPAMEKVFRAIVHEVSDTAGLASFSFGQEEDDRYVMLWKKEFAPSDDELLAYRKGEEWDPERAKEVARQKELEEKEETQNSAKPKSQFTPNSNYMEKYEHLIGRTAAKDAAVTTTANRSYGFVPSENKRDKRTVEQVLADSRAKKKQKTESGETGGAVSSDAVEPQTCEGRDGNAVSSDAVEPQTCEASDGNSATASS